jgi:hypothetical protein
MTPARAKHAFSGAVPIAGARLLVLVQSISDRDAGKDVCIPEQRERGERRLTRR